MKSETPKDYDEFNLFIGENYVNHWNLWMGFREIIQNLRDQSIKLGATLGKDPDHVIHEKNHEQYTGPNQSYVDKQRKYLTSFTYKISNPDKELGSILYSPEEKKVIFWNEGIIPVEGFALGGTDKQGEKNMIGRFGEGLKLAVLVFLKNGKDIIITSGKYQYTFQLKLDTKLTQINCLFLKKTDLPQFDNNTNITISNVLPEEWIDMCSNFLFLTDIDYTYVEDYEKKLGGLVVSHFYENHVFLQGILVIKEGLDNIRYGINYRELKLDRDRNSIPDQYERMQKSSNLIGNILDNFQRLSTVAKDKLNRSNFVKNVYELLCGNNSWTYYLYTNANLIPKGYGRNELFKYFTQLHNQNGWDTGPQPITASYTDVMRRIEESVRTLGMTYHYVFVSWQLMNTISQSTSYESFQSRYDRMILNGIEVKLEDLDKNEAFVIKPSESLAKAGEMFRKVFTDAFEMRFKSYEGEFRYKIGNNVVFSQNVFDYQKNKIKFPNAQNPTAVYIFYLLVSIFNISTEQLLNKLIP